MPNKNTNKQRNRGRFQGVSLPSARRPEGSVRIVGGIFKRTVLKIIDRDGVRPTSERLRETVFDWLTHLLGGIDGISVCDMFAGSGAMGFEALSRGASRVLCVEKDRTLCANIREVVEKLSVGDRFEVVQKDVFRVIPLCQERFDVIFIDPPFALNLQEKALSCAVRCLSARGIVYVESDKKIEENTYAPLGLKKLREGRAGQAHCVLLSRSDYSVDK